MTALHLVAQRDEHEPHGPFATLARDPAHSEFIKIRDRSRWRLT
jgi:hypothetical protein